MSAPASWLFTRGRQSVRLLRREQPDGRCELVVQGPGADGRSQVFETEADCMKHQADIERQLMAEGYTLQPTAERRRGADRRRRTRNDRRRQD